MKENTTHYSRRDFVRLSAIALATTPLLSFENILFSRDLPQKNELAIHLFSKHLQFLNYDDMSEAAAEMGFDGLDLTVRPGGHVLPERVTEDLPRAVEAMKKFGLLPEMMTTEVTNANDALTKTVLETASQLKFKYYRMGWLRYSEEETIPNGIEAYAKQFVSLEKINKELGLHGAYQNHTGKYVGAPIWDLYQILEGRSPEWIGCQYDIRHAVVEGGYSWELGLKLIRPFIKTIVIKDFRWGKENGKWKPVNTPLGEGMVDFGSYFSLLKKYNINVPISLHFEYALGGAENGKTALTIDKKKVFDQMKKDLGFLRETWEKAS